MYLRELAVAAGNASIVACPNEVLTLAMRAKNCGVGPQEKDFIVQLHAWFRSTAVGSMVCRNEAHIERFVGPVLAGTVVAAVLHLLDRAFGSGAANTGRAAHFIEAAVKHADGTAISLGVWLFALCAAMSGWLLVKALRRFIVLPFLEFLHHTMLLAAGALVALTAGAIWTAEPLALIGQLLWATLVLLVGGAEAQFAVWYCKAQDAQLYQALSARWHVFIGLLALAVLSPMLARQLQAVH